jgi:hypothetical protein
MDAEMSCSFRHMYKWSLLAFFFFTVAVRYQRELEGEKPEPD